MSSTWPTPPSLTTFHFGLENQSVNHSLLTNLSEENHPEFPLYLKLWATIASGIIFIVGVGGNILVPILVWKNKQMRHSTNIFLLNLALADCLILLICLPTALVELHTTPNTWILGAFMCRLVPFIEITVTRASIFTLTVISVERYIAICRPLRANSVCTRPRAFAVCLCIWPMSFLAAGPVIVATEYREQSSFGGIPSPSCVTGLHNSWTSGYFLGSAFIFFLCPLFFLSGIYFFIAKKLLNHRARSNKKLDNAHWNARKQVAAMLGAVVIIFFVCLLPFQILIVWVIQAPLEDINSLGPHLYFNILFSCRVLVYINAAANPIIYNAMSAKFRKAVVRLFAKEQKSKVLRRHSTLTTMFSSSSNTSSRSNSFRRIANLALRRSFSDASIRRQSEQPRLSSPSVLSSSTPSSPKVGVSPLINKAKDNKYTEKWYLKKGTSGSYFSGGDSVSSFSTMADESCPSAASRRAKFAASGKKCNPLLWDIENGCWNRSLPDIFPPSPGSVKRVSFKDTLPKERPRVVSPLAFTSQPDIKSSEETPKKSTNSSASKSISKYTINILSNRKHRKDQKRKLEKSRKENIEPEIQKLNGRQTNNAKNTYKHKKRKNKEDLEEENEGPREQKRKKS